MFFFTWHYSFLSVFVILFDSNWRYSDSGNCHIWLVLIVFSYNYLQFWFLPPGTVLQCNHYLFMQFLILNLMAAEDSIAKWMFLCNNNWNSPSISNYMNPSFSQFKECNAMVLYTFISLTVLTWCLLCESLSPSSFHSSWHTQRQSEQLFQNYLVLQLSYSPQHHVHS